MKTTPNRCPGIMLSAPKPSQRRHMLAATGLFALTAVGAGALGVAPIMLSRPKLDEQNCQVGVPAPEALIIYLDQSDPIPADELPAVKSILGRAVDKVVPGGFVAVRKLGATPAVRLAAATSPAREVAATGVLNAGPANCKPRDGKDANAWIENSRLMAREFELSFRKPIDEGIQSIGHAESQAHSAIIRGLAEIVADTKFREASRRRLMILSDMLEHSDIANMYRGAVDFAAVERRSFAAINSLRGSLDGAQVTITLVRNAESRRYHTDAHRKFWEDLFRHAGVARDRYRFERV